MFCKGSVCILCVFFCLSLGHFGFVVSPVSCALVFSVPSQEFGWKERLRNDLFCVEWDVKPFSISISTALDSPFADILQPNTKQGPDFQNFFRSAKIFLSFFSNFVVSS